MIGYKIVFGLLLVLHHQTFAQDSQDDSLAARQPRSLRKRLCRKFGICQGGGSGGFGGGYPGQGYPGQGYSGQIPPINIGISQSQSSSSAGGGGYSNGQYPNNYQYNQNRPGYGGHYPNNGYDNYQRPGYYGNGLNSYNNQYNGNYYNPYGGFGGGHGFAGPFGFDDYSEESRPQYDEEDSSVQNSDGQDDTNDDNYAAVDGFALAGRKVK